MHSLARRAGQGVWLSVSMCRCMCQSMRPLQARPRSADALVQVRHDCPPDELLAVLRAAVLGDTLTAGGDHARSQSAVRVGSVWQHRGFAF
jgi:hypothetical protein